MYHDRFGFLPTRLDLLWEQGQVRTLEQLDEAVAWFTRCLHPDGYYYPPIQHTMQGWPPEEAEKVSNSERGALLHKLPATHEIVLREAAPGDANLRLGLSGFAVHFLAFLVGHRAQFHDWWVDRRIPSRGHADLSMPSQPHVCICLNVAADTWLGASPRNQTVLINALFMHNRAPSYEWHWERFMVEYQVFDALFRVGERMHGLKSRTHAGRFEAVADHFGILAKPDVFDQIVRLRNDLFHEALWSGGMPTGGDADEAFRAPYWIHHINQRLALAVLGLTGPYTSSPWFSLVSHFLDLDVLRN